MLKFFGSSLVILLFYFSGHSQSVDENYQLVLSLDTKMDRKVLANEIMIDEEEKFIIVNYGNKPTYIIVYNLSDYQAVANFRLSDWVEFSGAYVDYKTNQLFIKESRYSSEYYRLDIKSGEQDLIQCQLTPNGCSANEPTKSLKSVFTLNKELFVTINKHNTRDVRVYKLKK